MGCGMKWPVTLIGVPKPGESCLHCEGGTLTRV